MSEEEKELERIKKIIGDPTSRSWVMVPVSDEKRILEAMKTFLYQKRTRYDLTNQEEKYEVVNDVIRELDIEINRYHNQKIESPHLYSEPLPWDNEGIQAWMTHKETDKLIELISKYSLMVERSPVYCEIGTYQGHSLKSVLPWVSKAISIDPKHFSTLDKLKAKWKSRIKFYKYKSQDIHAEIFDRIDILLIDGDHEFESAMADFLLYAPKVVDGGLIIFHDNYSFKGTTKFINKLKESERIVFSELESLAWMVNKC